MTSFLVVETSGALRPICRPASLDLIGASIGTRTPRFIPVSRALPVAAYVNDDSPGPRNVVGVCLIDRLGGPIGLYEGRIAVAGWNGAVVDMTQARLTTVADLVDDIADALEGRDTRNGSAWDRAVCDIGAYARSAPRPQAKPVRPFVHW